MEYYPYTKDEMRVAKYLYDLVRGEVGAGADPVGFLISSHAALVARCAGIREVKLALENSLEVGNDIY